MTPPEAPHLRAVAATLRPIGRFERYALRPPRPQPTGVPPMAKKSASKVALCLSLQPPTGVRPTTDRTPVEQLEKGIKAS
jgi:hypothetical protein